METTINEKSSVKYYYKELKKMPPLSSEEQNELVIKAKKGDQEASDKLVKSNLRFVFSIAKQYSYVGISIEDLISEGNIGLIQAIDKFEPEQGFKFISYAVWWVRQSILKFIQENSGNVRLPVNKINSTNKINKIKNRLYLKLGRDASDEEIVESDSTIKILDVKNYSNGKQEVSIDSSFTEDSEYGYADILEGDDYRKIIFSTNHNELTKEIRNVLCNLNKREAVIIKMFFGLEDEQSKKLKEIGDSLGLTMERVRQIKEDALRKLRTYNNSSRLIEFSNVDLNK